MRFSFLKEGLFFILMWEDGRKNCPNLFGPFEGLNLCQCVDREYIFQTRLSD